MESRKVEWMRGMEYHIFLLQLCVSDVRGVDGDVDFTRYLPNSSMHVNHNKTNSFHPPLLINQNKQFAQHKTPSMNQDENGFRFHGGSNTLKSNHITRYEYPWPLHHGIQALYLQPPSNASTRPRPQGRGDFGPNGAIFLTISRATQHATSEAELVLETANDNSSTNPLGRAMARVTWYPGNTLLQSGKFKKKEGFVYVIQRTTRIPVRNIVDGDVGVRGFAREEVVYVILCSRWRGMRTGGLPGHDGWWQRLHVRIFIMRVMIARIGVHGIRWISIIYLFL
ncbi:hypothetical protein T440DRAFT_188282 [Plenodomus tracheiphilus IPT5]|uniref:Uncharacterized protein n=1 Tax=Plenodomus tracheiphilus IPT5 TaxID=1408161 RepID=A0A6A7B045_9PLEO|nr:hypothetical protein T440DRAFT_188282 [Plenodomus tracheiphilus IPT5]